ncbi:protamine-like [Dendroctonus ponderosae]
MSRSCSRSGCRHIPVSVYCGKKGRSRSRRRRSSRKCRSRFRRRRSSRRSCGKRSRRRSRRRRGRKCRPGVKTKNPFLNYLRVFRKKHCRWPQSKIAVEGAKCWCKMNDQERHKFYKQACSMRKKGKGKRRRRKSRSRGRCGKRRRRSRRRKKKTCPM